MRAPGRPGRPLEVLLTPALRRARGRRHAAVAAAAGEPDRADPARPRAAGHGVGGGRRHLHAARRRGRPGPGAAPARVVRRSGSSSSGSGSSGSCSRCCSPTGRLPSRRWRPVLWGGVAIVALSVLGTAFGSARLDVGSGDGFRNPLAIGGPVGEALDGAAGGRRPGVRRRRAARARQRRGALPPRARPRAPAAQVVRLRDRAAADRRSRRPRSARRSGSSRWATSAGRSSWRR